MSSSASDTKAKKVYAKSTASTRRVQGILPPSIHKKFGAHIKDINDKRVSERKKPISDSKFVADAVKEKLAREGKK